MESVKTKETDVSASKKTEQKLLRKLYTRNIFAAMIAVLLCGAAIIISGNWKNLILGIAAVGWIAWSTGMIYLDSKKNNLEVIYAQSVASEMTKSPLENHKVLYHLVAPSRQQGVQQGVSIYIEAKPGKFRNGIVYALLFKRRIDGYYNESNFLCCLDLPPETDQTVCEETAQNKGNLLFFPQERGES